MPSYLTILEACLPVFLVIGAGYGVRRLRVLTAEADASLLRVAINLLFPAFVIDHLLGAERLEQGGTLPLAVGAGALFIVVGISLSYAVGGAIGLQGVKRRTFGVATGLQNYGFVPIPILISLFDGQTVAVHLMHTVGVEIALWTAAVAMLAGGRTGAWRRLFNAPLVTTLCCLAANAVFGSPTLPKILGGAVSMLSACAIPVSLLLIGATIRDLLRAGGEGDEPEVNPVVEGAAAVAVRMLLLPAAILLFVKFVPMPVELQRVMVVQAAMPGAVFPIILARRYGGDAATAVRVAVVTTFVATVSIPPVVVFGLWWTGAAAP